MIAQLPVQGGAAHARELHGRQRVVQPVALHEVPEGVGIGGDDRSAVEAQGRRGPAAAPPPFPGSEETFAPTATTRFFPTSAARFWSVPS